MTFSIAGRCAQSGMLGIAVTTSSIAVGGRCPWVRAGVGAVSTQNVTLPSLGPDILDRLEAGADADDALRDVIAGEKNSRYRQITVIDRSGHTAVFSGGATLGVFGECAGADCAASGNLLVSSALPAVMVRTFEETAGEHLAERLLRSLESGLKKGGGEQGPVRSAALLVASSHVWPLVDLRADWNNEPVHRLRRLWTEYRPQMDDYVQRALNPAEAPSFGVPGDE